MSRPRWHVRPKGERDVAAAVALVAEVAQEGRWIATEWPFDLDARTRATRDALLMRRIVGWVADEDGVCIGELTVFAIEAAEPELGMVVAAAHRGRGIGRALLASALGWARANGKAALVLRVFPDNAAALALYRSAGFSDVALQPGAIARRDGTARDVLLMRCACS